MQPATASDKAGFSIAEWCPLAGVSRATYYALPAESKPGHTYVGSRLVIVESPAAWLARAQQGGGITTKKRKPKRAPEMQGSAAKAT